MLVFLVEAGEGRTIPCVSGANGVNLSARDLPDDSAVLGLVTQRDANGEPLVASYQVDLHGAPDPIPHEDIL